MPLIDELRSIVDSYYTAVDHSTYEDAGQLQVRPTYVRAIMDLFAEGAAYHRLTQDFPENLYAGKAAIEGFFLHNRHLVGQHRVHEYHAEKIGDYYSVTTHGFFDGKAYYAQSSRGDHVRLAFSDTWQFNAEGKIAERWSTIAPLPLSASLAQESHALDSAWIRY
jgi:hypothetical protein